MRSSARPRCWRRAAGPPGDDGLGRAAGAHGGAARPRRNRTTIATSPSRTCRRCASRGLGGRDPRRAARAARCQAGAFCREYGLSRREAALLAADRDVAGYFEAAVAAGQEKGIAPKTVSNWITGELFRLLRAEGDEIDGARVTPQALADLIALVEKGTITANSGKTVLGEMFATGQAAAEIVEERGLAQVSDEEALAQIVEEIIAANPEQVARYRAGKETLLQWFVGQVMRATRGKANPQVVVAAEKSEEKLAGDRPQLACFCPHFAFVL